MMVLDRFGVGARKPVSIKKNRFNQVKKTNFIKKNQ